MLYLAGVADDSIVDGPGIRFTVFCQGCPHHCPGCHNPESWDFAGGTPYTPQALLARIQKNPLVRGVTLSGGEPFSQAAQMCVLTRLLKEAGYEVAAYTGYTFETLMAGTEDQRQLLSLLDILVDGPFVLAQRNLDLLFRGSDNQRILDVPASLAAGAAVLCTAPRWVGDPNDQGPACR